VRDVRASDGNNSGEGSGSIAAARSMTAAASSTAAAAHIGIGELDPLALAELCARTARASPQSRRNKMMSDTPWRPTVARRAAGYR